MGPGKRRRACYEEIYCTIVEVNGLCVSYWDTSETSSRDLDSIEVEETGYGTLRGIHDLIAKLSVEPSKE